MARHRGVLAVAASRLSAGGEDVPVVGYALEFVGAAVRELDVRSGHEVLDGARYEQFAGSSVGGNAMGDHDGESGDVLTAQLDLASVRAGSDLEAQAVREIARRERPLDCSSGPVKGRERAVAGRLHEVPSKALKLSLDRGV